MTDSFFSRLAESIGNASYGGFVSGFIPNQTLPTESIKVNKLHFGSTRLENVARMAEVSDGLIVKLPVMPAFKIPFSKLRSSQWSVEENKLQIELQFQGDVPSPVTLVVPEDAQSQLPLLLNFKETGSVQGADAVSDIDDMEHGRFRLDSEKSMEELWSIPKSSVNDTPGLNPGDIPDFGNGIRILVLVFVLGASLLYFWG